MADAPRAKKTFKMPAPVAPKPPQKPPPPKWKSAGEGGADVYHDLDGAFYKMTGMNALQHNISLLPEVLRDAAGCEMANIAADVIRDAMDNYVPVKLDHLRPSGRSDEYVPGRNIGITEIGMWFGGPPDLGTGGATTSQQSATEAGLATIDPSEYALIQHESLTFNHPNGGGPKYLERPLLAMLPNVLPRLAKAIAEVNGVSAEATLLQITRPTGPFGSPMGVAGGGPESGLGKLGGEV